MKKIFIQLLTIFLVLQTFEVQAQTPEPVISCQEKVRAKLKKIPKMTTSATVGAASYTAGLWLAASTPVAAGLGPAVLIGASYGLVFGVPAAAATAIAIRQHRKNILKIYEGAANGGNRKTEKLWRLANKKQPEAFKNMTYTDFLKSIHQTDIAGQGCELESVPERKDILNVVIDANDLLDDEEMPVGETVTDLTQKDSSRRSGPKKETSIPSSSDNKKSGATGLNQ